MFRQTVSEAELPNCPADRACGSRCQTGLSRESRAGAPIKTWTP